MTFLTDPDEIYKLYTQSKKESDQWREDYHEFERIADNELIDNLDPTLPEVNDGTLSASLFKLPKRIVSSNLSGQVKSLDRDEAWVTELANITWQDTIIPNANAQAPFHRKWKDAVRKAAIYGSVPIITLFEERGNYTGTDFIVAQPQDVKLEPGKVSDYDSDIIFWDIYYSDLQVDSIIEQAEEDKANKVKSGWKIKELKAAKAFGNSEERDPQDDHREHDDKDTRKKGIHFCAVFQRGVDAPFYIYHKNTKKIVREWTNQDPTGDIPIHFLYCYQDFVNPYGIGIVKLAGGTQNVLDYMRQSDVQATGLGLRPPVSIIGNTDSVDLSSIVYEQDALWLLGNDPNVRVKREEISNQIYQQLPERIQMYKSSLNQLLPMGDTSVSAGAGDPLQSKTPAGVKFAQANLSIDDEDFKDNLYMTYEAVAKSMINIHFANMEGVDIMKLNEAQIELLMKSGLDFPVDEYGKPLTKELEVKWDDVRSTFDFEVDAEADKTADKEVRLDGMLKIVELLNGNPDIIGYIEQDGKKLNLGELFGSVIGLLSDNEKIIEDISPEDQAQMEQAQMQEQQMMAQQAPMQLPAQAMPQGMPQAAPEAPQGAPMPQDGNENVPAVMELYGVDEPTAMAMIEAERQGFEPEEILAGLQRRGQ